MSAASVVVTALSWVHPSGVGLLSADDSPLPSPIVPYQEGEQVGSGPGAFWVTFIAAVLITILAFDMVRRLRRVRYREQVREQLAAEYQVTDQEFPDGVPTDDDDLDPFERKRRKNAAEDAKWEARARRRDERRARS